MAGHRQYNAGSRDYAAGGVPAEARSFGRVIRGLIVPRILESYVATSGETRVGLTQARAIAAHEKAYPAADAIISPADVDALCAAGLRDDLDAARQIVQRISLKGVVSADLLSGLIAPAAMVLGDKWLDDDCSFVDVTLGLGVFQILLRDVSGTATLDVERDGPPLTLRTFSVLAEQHTLGNLITGEMFRASGWAVVSDQPSSRESLLSEVRQVPFDVIGMSASSIEYLDDMSELARALKAASANPNTLIVAGGSAFARNKSSAGDFEGIDRVVQDLNGVEVLIRDLTAQLKLSRNLTRKPI